MHSFCMACSFIYLALTERQNFQLRWSLKSPQKMTITFKMGELRKNIYDKAKRNMDTARKKDIFYYDQKHSDTRVCSTILYNNHQALNCLTVCTMHFFNPAHYYRVLFPCNSGVCCRSTSAPNKQQKGVQEGRQAGTTMAWTLLDP